MSRKIPSTNKLSRKDLIHSLNILGQTSTTEAMLFHQKMAESLGMNTTGLKLITALMQEGPMTAGQIAERLHITSGAVTNLIDRLVSKGSLERAYDPADRRKVIIKPTPTIIAEGTRSYRSMGEAYATLLDDYTLDELRLLLSYTERLTAMTRQEIKKLN